MSRPTRLERALAEGRFAVTGELGPPKHAGAAEVAAKARVLGPVCDAINVTDNQAAQSRMCALAAARIARGMPQADFDVLAIGQTLRLPRRQ